MATLLWHRPNEDDSVYLNMAIAAAEQPTAPLLQSDTLLGITGLPIQLPVYRLHSFEVLGAALSLITGMEMLPTFHFVLASVGAVFAVFSLANLTRLLAPRHAWILLFLLLAVLVAPGETPRWYGNFLFVRMWQGKSWMLGILAPFALATGIRFGHSGNRTHLAHLAAAQVAGVGCSSSGLWLMPAFALMGIASGCPLQRPALRRLAWGAASSSYLLICSLLVRPAMRGTLVGTVLSRKTPDLDSSVGVVLGDGLLAVVAVAAIACAWLLAPTALARRVAWVTSAAPLLLLINPLTADWVSGHIVGPSFWRALWGLPVPLLMALVLAAPLRLRNAAAACSASGILVAAFLCYVPSSLGWSQENMVTQHWPPRPKVPPADLARAREIRDRLSPSDVVLVTARVGVWLTTLEGHPSPLAPRPQYVRSQTRLIGVPETRRRLGLTALVSGVNLVHWMREPSHRQLYREMLEQFETEVAEHRLAAVCFDRHPGLRSRPLRRALKTAGYHLASSDEETELWLLTTAPGPPVQGVARPVTSTDGSKTPTK